MKKPNKKVVASLCATSLATLGFISYKTIKKNPNLIKDLKDRYPKLNSILKQDIEKNEDIEIEEKNLCRNNKETIFSPNKEDKQEDIIFSNPKNLEEDKKEDISFNIKEIEEEQQDLSLCEEENAQENILKDSDLEFNQEFIDGLKAEIDELINFEKEILEPTDLEKTIIYEPIRKNKKNEQDLKLEEELALPDEYIEDEIRYQLCLTNKEKITRLTLEKLERIDFFEIDDNDMDIYCEFLSNYTHIKSIVIDSLNPIKNNGDILNYKNNYSLKDVSPLNKLINLEELSFNWGIENIDFSSLDKLSNLKKLELKFGMTEDISFLQNFKQLEHLEIMLASNVCDIHNILELDNLKKLYLYTNAKIDLDSLKNMKNLKYLYINGESVSI